MFKNFESTQSNHKKVYSTKMMLSLFLNVGLYENVRKSMHSHWYENMYPHKGNVFFSSFCLIFRLEYVRVQKCLVSSTK